MRIGADVRLVRPVIRRKEPGGLSGQAVEQHLDDSLPIQGVSHGLPDANVLQDRVLQIEPEVLGAVAGSGQNLDAGGPSQGFHLIGRQIVHHEIHTSLEHLLLAGDGLGDDLQADSRARRFAAKIIRERGQEDVLIAVEFLETVGTRPHRS